MQYQSKNIANMFITQIIARDLYFVVRSFMVKLYVYPRNSFLVIPISLKNFCFSRIFSRRFSLAAFCCFCEILWCFFVFAKRILRRFMWFFRRTPGRFVPGPPTPKTFVFFTPVPSPPSPGKAVLNRIPCVRDRKG